MKDSNSQLDELEATLYKQLDEIHRQKEAMDKAERQEHNYELFLKRPADWVISKAHCDPKFQDNGWHNPPGEKLDEYAIHINGNVGHTYFPTAMITNNTQTYFYNVWTDKQRYAFQDDLNKVFKEHMLKVVGSPRVVLELMGLQNDHYYLEETDIYPEGRLPEIKEALKQARWEVLDQFSDEQLAQVQVDAYRMVHSRHILKEYIQAKRPHLLEENQPCPTAES